MLNFFRNLFGKKKPEPPKDDLDTLIDLYLRKNGLLQVDYIPDFVERFFYRKLLNVILDQLTQKEFMIHGFKISTYNFKNHVIKCIREKNNRVTRLLAPQIKMVSQILEQEVDNVMLRMLLNNSIVMVLAFLFDTIQLVSFSCMGVTFKIQAQRPNLKNKQETPKRVLSEEEKKHINELACEFSSNITMNIPFVPDSFEENIYHQAFICLISLALKVLSELSVNVLGTGFRFDTTLAGETSLSPSSS